MGSERRCWEPVQSALATPEGGASTHKEGDLDVLVIEDLLSMSLKLDPVSDVFELQAGRDE